MKTQITDKEVLTGVKFLDLDLYLRGKGWTEAQKIENRSVSFVMGADYEVTVPLTREIGDYSRRIADVLYTLEKAESRSQQEILGDISAVMMDVIRIRVGNGELFEGQIPLEEGVQIVEKARELLLSAACSAVQPKIIYQKRKPDDAMRYLKRVKLGQTERGSFTVTLHSPITPVLAHPQQGDLFDGAPFERRVSTMLMKGLAAARTAVENAHDEQGIAAFSSRVNDGVSANLCDAIVGLMSYGDIEREAHIGINWASSRPNREMAAMPPLRFTPDFIPFLSEAVRFFKDTEPYEDFSVMGSVVRLDRQEGAQSGKVTVIAMVDEKPRSVHFELPDTEYDTACEAHRSQRPVSCIGLLVKEGGSLTLRNPTNFTLLDQ
jgi:hypothetical protein